MSFTSFDQTDLRRGLFWLIANQYNAQGTKKSRLGRGSILSVCIAFGLQWGWLGPMVEPVVPLLKVRGNPAWNDLNLLREPKPIFGVGPGHGSYRRAILCLTGWRETCKMAEISPFVSENGPLLSNSIAEIDIPK